MNRRIISSEKAGMWARSNYSRSSTGTLALFLSDILAKFLNT